MDKLEALKIIVNSINEAVEQETKEFQTKSGKK